MRYISSDDGRSFKARARLELPTTLLRRLASIEPLPSVKVVYHLQRWIRTRGLGSHGTAQQAAPPR